MPRGTERKVDMKRVFYGLIVLGILASLIVLPRFMNSRSTEPVVERPHPTLIYHGEFPQSYFNDKGNLMLPHWYKSDFAPHTWEFIGYIEGPGMVISKGTEN